MNLEKLSRAELTQLQKDIDKRLLQLDKEDRKAALAAAEEAARALGFSLEELTATKVKPPKAPAKYRHPESGQEWSGRGRRPSWLADIDDLTPYEI